VLLNKATDGETEERAGVSAVSMFRSGMGGVVGGGGCSPCSKSFSIWLMSLMHCTHPHFISVHLLFWMLYMTVAKDAQHRDINIPRSVIEYCIVV